MYVAILPVSLSTHPAVLLSPRPRAQLHSGVRFDYRASPILDRGCLQAQPLLARHQSLDVVRVDVSLAWILQLLSVHLYRLSLPLRRRPVGWSLLVYHEPAREGRLVPLSSGWLLLHRGAYHDDLGGPLLPPDQLHVELLRDHLSPDAAVRQR